MANALKKNESGRFSGTPGAPKSAASTYVDDNPIPDKRHRLQKGRRVNAPLAVSSVIVVAVLSLAGYFWHAHQKSKLNGSLRERATTLAESKDWRCAADYWQRYLWVAPTDIDARLSLIDAVAKGATSPRDRRRLSVLLHETIGLAPSDRADLGMDLRVRVAENLLAMGDFVNAYADANEILDGKLPGVQVEARSPEAVKLRRVRALSAGALARLEGNAVAGEEVNRRSERAADVTVHQAAEYLGEALQDSAGDIQVASLSASFYLQYGQALGEADFKESAGDIMDSLVAAREDDADALVARYRVRVAIEDPAAGDDLTAALKLEPAHYEGLLLSAGVAAKVDLDNASAIVQKAIDSSPNDARGYMALAQLEGTRRNWSAAVKALRDGRRIVGPNNLVFNSLLTSFLIHANDVNGAKESFKELEEAFQSQLAELNSIGRRNIQDQLQLLRAKIAAADGDLASAVISLKAVVASAEQSGASQATQLNVEATELLGQFMEQLGSWDVAAGLWLELAKIPAKTGDATRRAATAYLAAGQLDQAIQQADRYLSPPAGPRGGLAWTPAPEACLLLVQAHLQKQMLLPSSERNWSEFERALALAKQLNPPRVATFLAEFEHQQALGREDSSEMQRTYLLQAKPSLGTTLSSGGPPRWVIRALASKNELRTRWQDMTHWSRIRRGEPRRTRCSRAESGYRRRRQAPCRRGGHGRWRRSQGIAISANQFAVELRRRRTGNEVGGRGLGHRSERRAAADNWRRYGTSSGRPPGCGEVGIDAGVGRTFR